MTKDCSAGVLHRAIFAGGGTGGHLYPGLAVAELLRQEGCEVSFVGTTHGLGAKILPPLGYPLDFIRARGFSGGVLGKLKAVAELSLGLVQSLWLLHKKQPQIVIGSGGYVCAPVVLAAKILGIPSMLMEQNAFAGKAVRFMSRFAEKVCTSWPGHCEGIATNQEFYTGNPIRQSITAANRQAARASLQIADERLCLLIAGGSQGAASINRAILAALPAWANKNWTVIHLTGSNNFDEVKTRSQDLLGGGLLDYRPIGYTENIAELYAAADLIVCRSGATTLAEVTARGLASVLVPYPYAAENHQEANAKVLVESGAAQMVPDNDAENLLPSVIASILDQPGRLTEMAVASLALARPEAAAQAAQLARQIVAQQVK